MWPQGAVHQSQGDRMRITNRPLLITTDQELMDEVISIATGRAIEMQVESSLTTARRAWMSASAVLVGADALSGLSACVLPRRSSLIVVAPDEHKEITEREMWRMAVEMGAENVLLVPAHAQAIGDILSVSREGPPRHGRIVAVIPGSGGVGASTVSLAVAQLAVKRGVKTLVIDADPFGGGLDLLAGVEDESGIRWDALIDAHGRLPAPALEDSLVRVAGVSLLSFGRDGVVLPDASIAQSVLETATRIFDLVVVDSGRNSFSDLFVERAHVHAVVVRNHVRAAAAAAARMRALEGGASDVHVLIACDAHGIDAEGIARALGVEGAAVLPFLPGMGVRADDGEGMGMPRALSEALNGLIDAVCATDSWAA